jgi:hypothetical protein
MTDRRRAIRFIVSSPAPGRAWVPCHVLERVARNVATIIAIVTSDPRSYRRHFVGGVLVRHHQVFVRNISRGGGRLEMRTPLANGAAGVLKFVLQGESCTERFRVCRVTRIEGAGVFHVAVEFLSMGPGGHGSLRGVLTALEAAEASGTLGADQSIVWLGPDFLEGVGGRPLGAAMKKQGNT